MSVLENISEKRKPGRPRILSPDAERGYRAIVGDGASLRTYQNRRWEGRAMALLGFMSDDPTESLKYKHLCDMEGQVARKPRTFKHVILAELGRVENADELVELADYICAHRLTTATAVAAIRRVRFGERTPEAERLVDALLAVINAHIARYPLTHPDEITRALDQARFAVTSNN